MKTNYRKALVDTGLDYFDTQSAINDISAGAYAKLPYTCLLYTSDAADE